MVVSGRVPHTITWDQIHWSVSAQIASDWPDSDLASNTGDTGTIDILVGDSFEPDNTLSQAQPVDVPLLGQRTLQTHSVTRIGSCFTLRPA